jgi:HK97 family phage prohead protease
MKQTRFIPAETCGLQLREPQEGQQENRTIEGRPIVFGVRSVNLTPWSSTRKVYEVLEPGCISRELLQKSDVVLNLNHSNMVPDVLGRYRNTDRDTLSLELRGDGIDCRCELPNTSNANDALELIKRGDINGMSFAFEDDYEDTENGVSYERTNDVEDGKEVWLRHVKKITGLYDVSIVTHPAYEQTTVGMREASDAIDKAIEAQLKREAGNQETEEERKAREEAEAAAKAEEERKARKEAEAKAKAEQEERELEEMAQRAREQQIMRMRAKARRLNDEILSSLEY